jgi:hypothetical protein
MAFAYSGLPSLHPHQRLLQDIYPCGRNTGFPRSVIWVSVDLGARFRPVGVMTMNAHKTITLPTDIAFWPKCKVNLFHLFDLTIFITGSDIFTISTI